MPFDIGLGTRLYVEIDNDTNTYTELPALVSVKLPAAKVKEVQTPHLNQTSRINPRQPGSLDPGDLDFSIYYDSYWHLKLGTWAYAGDTKRWRAILPNGVRITFDGYLDEPEIEDLKNDEPVTIKVMVHLTTGTTLS